jgi:hypothetical protein
VESVVTMMARKVNEIVSAGIAQKMSLQGGEGFHMHPPADEKRNGFMTVADRILLNNRTSQAIPKTLIERDASGRAKVGAPADPDDIARKHEVDNVTSSLNKHISSRAAHTAQNITYTGNALGNDVKQAIDGLDNRIDNLILENGDSSPEVADARGGYDVLGERLNASDGRVAGITDRLDTSRWYSFAYKKRIAMQLPLCPTHYQTILSAYGYSYIYPQDFYVDEENNELFIVYSSSGGSNAWQWVCVLNWSTGQQKRMFSAGTSTGEGVYVSYDGATRWLFVKGDTSGRIAKYDITTLPNDLVRLTPTIEYNVDLYSTFSARNQKFYVESLTQPVGVKARRYLFTIFESDLTTRSGEVEFSIFDSGDLNEYENYIPKRQAIDIGDGFIAASYGAFYNKGIAYSEKYMQGTKIFDMNGKPMSSAMLNSEKMITVLENEGFECTRIENEGIYVSKDNRIYSLYITLSASDSNSGTSGIVIFEDFSNDKEAIDFESAAAVGKSYPSTNQYYPLRTQGSAIYNPVTGAKFTTLNEIMDFMVATDCREFSFYTSGTGGITNISGTVIPGSALLTIYNMNNSTAFYQIKNSAIDEWYLVNGSPRTETRALFPMDFRPATSGDPISNGDIKFLRTSNTSITIKLRGTDGIVRSANITLS